MEGGRGFGEMEDKGRRRREKVERPPSTQDTVKSTHSHSSRWLGLAVQ